MKTLFNVVFSTAMIAGGMALAPPTTAQIAQVAQATQATQTKSVQAEAKPQEIVVPLSKPGGKVDLEVNVMRGSVKVLPGTAGQVRIEVTPRSEDEREAPERSDGMRRIPNRSIGLNVQERDNHVEVHSEWSGPPLDLVIYTPVNTSAHLGSIDSGVIEVKGLNGEHELSNTDGSIRATQMRGSIVATTSSGDVTIELLEVAGGKAMSFSTWSGELDVTLPATLRADLKMKAGQGEILTDFDVEIIPTEAKVERDDQGRGFELHLDREVHAKVGGGGPEIRLRTANGSIYLRKP